MFARIESTQRERRCVRSAQILHRTRCPRAKSLSADALPISTKPDEMGLSSRPGIARHSAREFIADRGADFRPAEVHASRVHPPGGTRRIGLWVCDMNCRARSTVSLLTSFWERGLLEPGCRANLGGECVALQSRANDCELTIASLAHRIGSVWGPASVPPSVEAGLEYDSRPSGHTIKRTCVWPPPPN